MFPPKLRFPTSRDDCAKRQYLQDRRAGVAPIQSSVADRAARERASLIALCLCHLGRSFGSLRQSSGSIAGVGILAGARAAAA
jgi:hypothetical protein